MSSCHEPVYVDFNTIMTDDQERVWIHPSEVRHWFRPGLRVHLWAEDLLVDATLEHNDRDWLARPDWSTRRDQQYS